MGARRHVKWRWFLATALVLSLLNLAVQGKGAPVAERTDASIDEAARGGVASSTSRSLLDRGVLALQGAVFVDANGPGDPLPGDPNVSDPDEDGTADHPFDSVFEAMATASDGDTILVAPGCYTPVNGVGKRLEFAGRNIRLKSTFEDDFTQIERTVLDATIVFDGTEGPDCELAGFKIHGAAFEGISGNGTAATLRDCIIQGNSTCDGSVLTDFYGEMTHCLIADNTSAFACGSRPVVMNFGGTMVNCTIVNNATGISVQSAEIVNCIFYYNGIQTIRVQDQGSLMLSHSNVQGGDQAIVASETGTAALTSIMGLNPRFVRLGVWEDGQVSEGDYHLKSQGLRWSLEPVADSHWVCDAVTSSCIDSGDPSHDVGAEIVVFPSGMDVQSRVNWQINMGCYGGTAQASLPFVDRIVSITAVASSAHSEDEGPERSCDNSGVDADDLHSTVPETMWLSDDWEGTCWIQYEFNRTYVLYEMWVWNYNTIFEFMLGFGVKDVTITYSEDGVDWAVFGEVQFAQAPAMADYPANTVVALDGIVARYVRFTIKSSWGVLERTGLSEVRFFADLTPRAEPSSSYELILDTFEAYNSLDNRIYDVWLDSWVNGTGSVVGYFSSPFAEQWIVNSGQQSMPLFYDNKVHPYYSEAWRDLEVELQDWYVGDADALTLYLCGSTERDSAGQTDRLYVTVEDNRGTVAVVQHPDPNVLLVDDWHEWTIGFEEFGEVDLGNVTRLVLGVGDRNDPQRGGEGVVYIDDAGLSVRPMQSDVLYAIPNVVASSNAESDEDTGPENTVNGSGLNDNDEHSVRSTDMWLGVPDRSNPAYIQFAFDKVYELQEMWVWNYNVQFELLLGFGVKDATVEYSEDGTNWVLFGDVQLAQGAARDDYAVGTIVELGGISAQYVRLTVQSGWGLMGQFGLSEVRFLTHQIPSSSTWSYTLMLDSFETYAAAEDSAKTLAQVWRDGWENGTGAQVGYPPSPFTEQDIVNSGGQAMPLFYNNTLAPFYSETYRDLEPGLQNWLAGGAEALMLYFCGDAERDRNMAADRLYVVVEDHQGRVAEVYHPNPATLLDGDWQTWTIDFNQFIGVDLSHITRLTLGVGDRDKAQPGDHSVVYIDDIGLVIRVENIR